METNTIIIAKDYLQGKFFSKKSAKLVAENLKEYDDTLRIYICKIY